MQPDVKAEMKVALNRISDNVMNYDAKALCTLSFVMSSNKMKTRMYCRQIKPYMIFKNVPCLGLFNIYLYK